VYKFKWKYGECQGGKKMSFVDGLPADLSADLPADLSADLPADSPADLPAEVEQGRERSVGGSGTKARANRRRKVTRTYP